MKHSVCFIDDKIPVSQYSEYFSETDIVSNSVIKYLLKHEATEWSDPIVKKLCEKLVNESEKWIVSAFTSPAFYDNYTKDTVFSPEIIIYDWDYNFGAASDDSKNHLLKILQESYTMIFIFSGSDNTDEIEQIFNDDVFNKYQERLCVIDKNDEGSVDKIFLQISQKEQNNYSFAYGFNVVSTSNKAINRILSEFSLLSKEEFVASIVEDDGNKYILTNDDFVDALIPHYISTMRSYSTNSVEVKKTVEPNLENIRKVWSYRLYDKRSNGNVQMGDIIRGTNGDYFLVVSSDCQLLHFWKKNFGFLTLVPLLPVSSTECKQLLKRNNNTPSLKSLTSNTVSTLTVLPCIPLPNDNKLIDCLLVPKNIISIEIQKEDGDITDNLSYGKIKEFEKITSVIDPFKSPLVQFVFDNIPGYGCPDFPKIMQKDMQDKIKNILNS